MFVGVVAPATGSTRIGAGTLAGIAARSITCNSAINRKYSQSNKPPGGVIHWRLFLRLAGAAFRIQ